MLIIYSFMVPSSHSCHTSQPQPWPEFNERNPLSALTVIKAKTALRVVHRKAEKGDPFGQFQIKISFRSLSAMGLVILW